MKKAKFLAAAAAIAIMAIGCNNAEMPAENTIEETQSETAKNTPSISQDQVQGSWELISITGEGADFEMLKGTVLKFDLDKLKKTQNTNEEVGTFYILNGEMHYTPEGLNEVVWQVSIVDGNLQTVNNINQILTYKKI